MEKYKFKGHETFYFREGWLSKAMFYMANENATSMFSNIKEGILKLGVGANMVKSIKYWLLATGLIEYEYRNRGYHLTELGNIISQNDMYLENNLTLWLLHFHLITNKSAATTWYVFWNEFRADIFDMQDVINFLTNYLNNEEIAYNENALRVDVSVLLNMYSKVLHDEDPEENIVCPLSRLGLISQNQNSFEKNTPYLEEGQEIVVLYILANSYNNDKIKYIDQGYMKLSEAEEILSQYMNLNRLLISEYLDLLKNQYINIVNNAGLDMIYFNENLEINQYVREYYEGVNQL